jgi:peptidoglycan lytic transglycosylase A
VSRAIQKNRGFLKSLVLVAFVFLPLWAAFSLLKFQDQGLSFKLVPYDALPGWSAEAAFDAQPALLKSCKKILSLPDKRRMPGANIGGRVRDWKPACLALAAVSDPKDSEAVFKEHFLPLEVSVGGATEGVFTGYYETLLKGSFTKSERFNVPLYARPPELVMVDLGRFRKSLAGQRIAGSVKNGQLRPYSSRAKIEGGALDGRDLEVLWVDSAVDAYFLHVQGSGRVLLPDGSFMGIGYAAQNGHANRLIGRYLIETGAIARADMSGQAIRSWLAKNPNQVQKVLNSDPSFVFFRPLKDGIGPFGAVAVALTPAHSLAIDRTQLPLHAPLWLAASHPDPAKPNNDIAFTQLMVAQDTGGAINGAIRGDVFWGFGKTAAEIAGRMNNKGRYWLLLPPKLARAAAEQSK